MDIFPIQQPWFAWVAAAAGVAGAVRGLTGFGSALILVPILSMFLGPVVAVPVLNIVDGVATLLLLPDAVRRCRWSEVIPLFVGALVLLPFGVYALRSVDPATLRHVMSVVILGIVGCMAVGARYAGAPSRTVGAGVGALSGLGVANNLYSQIGLILLIALGSKNAILVVEYARQKRAEGMDIMAAAVEGARLRFRPILMTSFAFILGVLPLVVATGAGAGARRSIGIAVFSGMIASTCLVVVFVPSFYVVMQRIEEWRAARRHPRMQPAS